MPTWILIIFIAGGREAGAITSVPGFATPKACQMAGQQTLGMIKGASLFEPSARFVCVADGVVGPAEKPLKP